jgi:hypothetical protein
MIAMIMRQNKGVVGIQSFFFQPTTFKGINIQTGTALNFMTTGSTVHSDGDYGERRCLPSTVVSYLSSIAVFIFSIAVTIFFSNKVRAAEAGQIRIEAALIVLTSMSSAISISTISVLLLEKLYLIMHNDPCDAKIARHRRRHRQRLRIFCWDVCWGVGVHVTSK